MSAVQCIMSAVQCVMSAVQCMMSAVQCMMSAVQCMMSAVQCIMSAVQSLYRNRFLLHCIETQFATYSSLKSINHILLPSHTVNKLTHFRGWGGTRVIHYTLICNLSKTISPVAGSTPSILKQRTLRRRLCFCFFFVFLQLPVIGIIIIKPDEGTGKRECKAARC
jgi:hypothetical protein